MSKTESWQQRVAREKKDAILDAATQAFLDTGYDRTTLEHIARAAEVSTGTLFKHFPTKAKLFGGIIERAWTETVEDMAQPGSGSVSEELRRIGLDYANRLSQVETVALFRVIIAEAPRFPELGQALYERGKAPYLERLEQFLTDASSKGSLEPRDSWSTATREFLGMVNDQVFWPRLLIVDFVPEADVVEAVVDSAVATFLTRYSIAVDGLAETEAMQRKGNGAKRAVR